jgi:hypothetical protein
MVRSFDLFNRLVEVNDVDPVTISENVALHLGVPAPGLMTKMNTSIQELTSGNDSHSSPFVMRLTLTLS